MQRISAFYGVEASATQISAGQTISFYRIFRTPVDRAAHLLNHPVNTAPLPSIRDQQVNEAGIFLKATVQF